MLLVRGDLPRQRNDLSGADGQRAARDGTHQALTVALRPAAVPHAQSRLQFESSLVRPSTVTTC
jgi:hypothetical protein